MDLIRTDVLVVGAGPAGSVAAHQLVREGVETLLIDRATFPREKVCGESFSPGAVARLRAIGMWALDHPPAKGHGHLAAETHAITGMRIRSPRGTTFEGRYRTQGSGPGIATRRFTFDADLVSGARSRGVKLMEGIEAIGCESLTNGTAVVHARPRGSIAPLQIHAKRVIVADGRRSFLARSLGFIEPARPERSDRRYAVRAHWEGLDDLSNLAEMHVGESGYCGIAPLSAGTANVCYVRFGETLDMQPRALEANFRAEIARYTRLAPRFERARISESVRVIGPLRLTSRRQLNGPFLACGDTTGFLDPFTGEGISHAVATGVLGARAVRCSLQGESGSLQAYEGQIRSLRRIKGAAALAVHALVSYRGLANAASLVFALTPGLGDLAVRLFGDQI